MDQSKIAAIKARKDAGRTTRLFQFAKEKADAGNTVIVVMATKEDAEQWKKCASPEITVETPEYLEKIGIKVSSDLARVSHIRVNRKCILIDHAVIQ